MSPCGCIRASADRPASGTGSARQAISSISGNALGGIVAFGAIAASIFTGGNFLGVGFSAIMIALACGYILYDTSNILHHYHTSQHVAASLALFSSVVLLFWYVLRIMLMFASEE